MRITKMVGIAIAAVMALSAVAAASASAEEFIASKTGTLKAKALSTQTFQTKSGGTTVVCTKLSLEKGEVVEPLKKKEQQATVKYETCEVEGLGGTASITPANYTFLTEPAAADVKEAITITANAIGVVCKVSVGVQSALKAIKYVNLAGGKVEIEAKVTGISSTIVESNSSFFCGSTGEKSSTGTYNGNSEVELEGGTIEVK